MVFRWGQVFSLLPGGNQSMHNASHCHCNSLTPGYCCSVYSMPSWQCPKGLFHPTKSNSARAKCDCILQVNIRSHVRASERSVARTVKCRLSHPAPAGRANMYNSVSASLFLPLKTSALSPSPWSDGNGDGAGTATSTRRRRGKPPSCLVDFVFTG